MNKAILPSYDELPETWCPFCKRTVKVISEDFGIGQFEYWGDRGFHRDIRQVCERCLEEINVT